MIRPENPYKEGSENAPFDYKTMDEYDAQSIIDIKHEAFAEGATAQLRAVVKWVEREDGFRSDSNSIYLGIPKSKWLALKAELKEAPE